LYFTALCAWGSRSLHEYVRRSALTRQKAFSLLSAFKRSSVKGSGKRASKVSRESIDTFFDRSMGLSYKISAATDDMGRWTARHEHRKALETITHEILRPKRASRVHPALHKWACHRRAVVLQEYFSKVNSSHQKIQQYKEAQERQAAREASAATWTARDVAYANAEEFVPSDQGYVKHHDGADGRTMAWLISSVAKKEQDDISKTSAAVSRDKETEIIREPEPDKSTTMNQPPSDLPEWDKAWRTAAPSALECNEALYAMSSGRIRDLCLQANDAGRTRDDIFTSVPHMIRLAAQTRPIEKFAADTARATA
jgi:hypothetical protein